MLNNLFSWIREGVRQAVLGGLADAVQDISGGRADDGSERLRQLLAAPTPEPIEEPARNGRRAKAVS